MPQGMVLKTKLDEQELTDLRSLAETCERHDGIRLKLNWDMLQERSGDKPNDLLFYRDGKLIAFLGIYIVTPPEVELSGMVHPDYRRQGIFGGMADEALRLISGWRLEPVIYICPGNSASGSAFLRTRGLTYSFSEHGMERDGVKELNSGNPPQIAGLALREAQEHDAPVIAELNRSGFQKPEHDEEPLAAATILPNELIYLIEIDGRVVGKLGVLLEESTAFIFGFVVRAGERGRGIGRSALTGVIELLQRERHVSKFELEVAVDNERALGLYESCGFRRTNTIDYYK